MYAEINNCSFHYGSKNACPHARNIELLSSAVYLFSFKLVAPLQRQHENKNLRYVRLDTSIENYGNEE